MLIPTVVRHLYWKKLTRMHSSRMRTARLLPVSPSMHCSGGCTWSVGGVPGPGESAWSGRGAVPGPTGVYLVPGVCTWSVGCIWSRGCTWWGIPAQVLPSVNRMTDRCKNITLPQTSFAGGNNINNI